MVPGARVTDSVSFLERKGELRRAVRLVRGRPPERFRWRTAVSWVTASAGRMFGRDRFRVEEPVREMVLDLPDRDLRREVVLDARRFGVDLDRGEVLPQLTLMDLTRLAFLAHTPLQDLRQLVELPHDLFSPIDPAAAVLGSRALSHDLRLSAQSLMLRLPDPDVHRWTLHERSVAERASRQHRQARRWGALGKAITA